MFLHQEYHTACLAAVIYTIFLFCTIKDHKKQNKQTKNPTETNKTKTQAKQKHPSVHTWFSAARKSPIFTVFSCRNFEFLVLQCSFESSSRRTLVRPRVFFSSWRRNTVLDLGLSKSQEGPWALDCPTACKDSKRVTAGPSVVPKYLEDVGPRREGSNVHQKWNQKEWEKENF